MVLGIVVVAHLVVDIADEVRLLKEDTADEALVLVVTRVVSVAKEEIVHLVAKEVTRVVVIVEDIAEEMMVVIVHLVVNTLIVHVLHAQSNSLHKI